jgi:membrane protease YdiL (CAAX protease family)
MTSARSGLARYHLATRAAPTAALTVLPLFLAYSLGLTIASPEARSGADFATDAVLSHLGKDGYLAVTAAVALALLAFAFRRLGRQTGRHSLLIVPVTAEACAYALVMGSTILLLMEEAGLLGPLVVLSRDLVDRTVLSAGAGLHEELLFRLLLIPALAWGACQLLAMPRPLALAVAVLGSAALFALAHHLNGEPFDAYAFSYRLVAGCLFGGLYLARGFAVTAWTHATYDFYVLGLQS